jgi:glutathione S-transferase
MNQSHADESEHDDDEPIFHIAVPEDWAAAFTSGEYTMSTRGLGLETVGFIHCSTEAQVEATAARFYGDLDALVLLTIDPLAVRSEIKWEPPAPGVDELFPHIYGPLPVAAVNTATFWTRAATGPWELTD